MLYVYWLTISPRSMIFLSLIHIFGDLKKIRNSFIKTLKSIHHNRIAYPSHNPEAKIEKNVLPDVAVREQEEKAVKKESEGKAVPEIMELPLSLIHISKRCLSGWNSVSGRRAMSLWLRHLFWRANVL